MPLKICSSESLARGTVYRLQREDTINERRRRGKLDLPKLT